MGSVSCQFSYRLFSSLRSRERGEGDVNFPLKRKLPQFLLPVHRMLRLEFIAPVVRKERRYESEGHEQREVS